jgi:hypothetical protein
MENVSLSYWRWGVDLFPSVWIYVCYAAICNEYRKFLDGSIGNVAVRGRNASLIAWSRKFDEYL